MSASGKSATTVPSGEIAILPAATEQPVVTEPVVTEPVFTEPVVTQPVVTEPVVTEPVVTEPVVTEPVVTEPPTTLPAVTEPATTQPVAAASSTPSQLVATASEVGTVVLRGSVPDEAARTALTNAFTQALPPGSAFDNQLTVDPAVSMDGASLQLAGTARPDLFDALGKVATDATGLKLAADNQVVVAQAPALETELNALLASEPIQFVSGSAAIDPKSNATLTTAAAMFAAAPTGNATIEGHTDNRGKPATNQALSEARAEAVRSALVAKGVAAGRLTAVGYGQDRPVADNASPDGRAKNRRVEILVTG